MWEEEKTVNNGKGWCEKVSYTTHQLKCIDI